MTVPRFTGAELSATPSDPLVLPWPCLCSDNRRFQPIDGRNCLTTDYTRAKSAIRQRAKLWWRGREAIAGPCELEAHFWFPDRRKRDVANYAKAIHDALSGAVYVDDGLIARVVYQRAGYDKTNPRCEVSVRPLADLEAAA